MNIWIIVILVLVFLLIGCFIYYCWIEPAIFRSILSKFENGNNEWSKDSGPKDNKKE